MNDLYNLYYFCLDCGANITVEEGMEGTITSPAYPCEYPNNASCTWTIDAYDTGWFYKFLYKHYSANRTIIMVYNEMEKFHSKSSQKA